MNHEELLRLRNKHSACFADTYKDQYVCQSCSSEDASTRLVFYPCDVIKALDEVDRVMNAAEVYGLVVRAMTEQNSHETITELPNCDHVRELGFVPEVGRPYYYRCDHCPKCGEKL